MEHLRNVFFILIFSLSTVLYSQELPSSLFPYQDQQTLEFLLNNKVSPEDSIDFNPTPITNKWTLQDAIDAAVRNNYALAQAKKELDIAKANYTGSIQDFYVPNLAVSMGITARDLFTTSKNPVEIAATSLGFTYNLAVPTVTLSKTLFNGFGTLYAYRTAKETYLNTQNTYSNMIRETIYETTVRFYDQFLKIEETRVALERIKQLKNQLQLAEVNYKNGRVSDYDVSVTRSQFYLAQPEYYTAEKNRIFSRQEFYRYIGYQAEPDTRIELEGDLFEVTNVMFSKFDENHSIAYFLSNDTDIASLRTAYKNAKNQKGQINAARMPKLDAFFNYNPSFGENIALNNFAEKAYNGSYSVGATLSVPILEWIPGTGAASKVKAAKEKVIKSEYALLEAQGKKLNDIRNTLLTMRQTRQNVDALRISEAQSQRAIDIARVQYRYGRISVLELNQAEVDYIEAKRKLLLSIYTELQTKLILQKSIHGLEQFINEINKIGTQAQEAKNSEE